MADEPGRFRIRKFPSATRSGEFDFQWQLVTLTGQVIATSERFPNLQIIKNTIKWLINNVAKCRVEEP